MPVGLNFEQIYGILPYPLDIAPFKIKYGPYAVTGGPRAGYRSQRSLDLVTAYAEGLKNAFEALKDRVFTNTNPPGLIQVAVCHIPDYLSGARNEPTTIPSRTGPRILLSNRSSEISTATRVDRARTEATHEVCHVFQFTKRPRQDDPVWDSWEWMNDAAAVYCEQLVHPGGAESCFYCQDWLDSPEVSLDKQTYPSSMFVRWYASKFTPKSIGQIWEDAKASEGPLDAIEAITARSINDLFTDYARDGFFLCDPASPCYYPDVHFLWGTREIRKRFVLPAENGNPFAGSLDHLAAEYFEVRVGSGVSSVECTFESIAEPTALRAWIAEVKYNLHRGATEELKPLGASVRKAAITLSGSELDYLVIVVTNGSRSQDKVSFKLTVTAVV